MDAKNYAENLIEAREILELTAVKLAAERRTPEDLQEIKAAQSAFCDQKLDYIDAIEEDLLFHLEVVAASKNDVLKSLYLKIFPDLFDLFNKKKRRDHKKFFIAIHEHDKIIEHIANQDEVAAVETMRLHLGKWKD